MITDITFNQYQELSSATAIYPGHEIDPAVWQGTEKHMRAMLGLSYLGLKVNGEAGEIAEFIGKFLRDDQDKSFDEAWAELTKNVKKEIGDVLWYLAQIAKKFGLTFEECANGNLSKLADRQERGVLGGSGDER